jgi:hypothetical protein
MFVAVMAAIVPGTLWAVDPFQNVAIQDPVSGHKASVDAGKRLITYDWVGSADEIPANFARFYNGSQTTGCTKIATPPAGKALIVRTLALDTWVADSIGAGHSMYFYVGAACSGIPVFAFNPSGIGLVTSTLTPGITVPAGQSLWRFKGSSAINVDINGAGYVLPANWVPATPPSVTPAAAAAASSQNLPR